ncbi:hypothetical protein [Lysobacter sp. TY2-98]|uniref:hypothetical protein n=1 Tax=Lysobacter sp. TY2-98 TaxID=2290922 RepID=UPI0013B3CFBA|nr:hypothetical protein [Lysobacter sp. TY2-98]
MKLSSLRIQSKPLILGARLWLLGWLAVIAVILVAHSGAATSFAVFLPFHWAACWYMSRAARDFGLSPWVFGLVPAILPPMYLLLSSKLRWRAWAAAYEGSRIGGA